MRCFPIGSQTVDSIASVYHRSLARYQKERSQCIWPCGEDWNISNMSRHSGDVNYHASFLSNSDLEKKKSFKNCGSHRPLKNRMRKVSQHKMRRWGTNPKIRRDGSLFSRIWGRVGLEAVLFETMSFYIPHHKHWKEKDTQRTQRTASDFTCLFHHLWIKSNINSHLPRVHQCCVEARGVWGKGERVVCGLCCTLMRHLGEGEPTNSAEGLHGSSTRQPAPQRASLILSWLTLRAESLQAGPSLHSQTYPGLACWEGATGVGPDDQIKCLPEFRPSWLYRIPVISVLVTGSNILCLAAQVNG